MFKNPLSTPLPSPYEAQMPLSKVAAHLRSSYPNLPPRLFDQEIWRRRREKPVKIFGVKRSLGSNLQNSVKILPLRNSILSLSRLSFSNLPSILFIASLIAGPLIPKCRPISLYLPHHSVSLLDCELNFEGLTPGPSFKFPVSMD